MSASSNATGTREGDLGEGLLSGHAYTVLGAPRHVATWQSGAEPRDRSLG